MSFAKQTGKSSVNYLNNNGFHNVQAGSYWSSSPYAGDSTYAWYVIVNYGYVGPVDKAGNDYVWPVRGGK